MSIAAIDPSPGLFHDLFYARHHLVDHPIELDRDRFLRRTLAMELVELDELQQAFRDKALKDKDVASATLLVKVAERRATLLGLNPPLGHAVQVVQHEPNKPTSTERIRAVLDQLIAKPSLPSPDDEPDDPPATQ